MRAIAAALVILAGAVVFSAGPLSLGPQPVYFPGQAALIGLVAGGATAAYGFRLLSYALRDGDAPPPAP
jgi:hypothetical protein